MTEVVWLFLAVAGAWLVASAVRRYVVGAYVVSSGSMSPTLLVGDRVLVSRLTYRLGTPLRGDLVVFAIQTSQTAASHPPRHPSLVGPFARPGAHSRPRVLIKRVVALEGEVLNRVNWSTGHHARVPRDTVFVLGDNAEVSRDSRSLGPIAIRDLVGRAFIIVWPPLRLRLLTRGADR
jgi:signal peptidase I